MTIYEVWSDTDLVTLVFFAHSQMMLIICAAVLTMCVTYPRLSFRLPLLQHVKFSVSPVNSPKNISLCHDGERDVNTNVLQYYYYHVINVKVSCGRSDLVIYGNRKYSV